MYCTFESQTGAYHLMQPIRSQKMSMNSKNAHLGFGSLQIHFTFSPQSMCSKCRLHTRPYLRVHGCRRQDPLLLLSTDWPPLQKYPGTCSPLTAAHTQSPSAGEQRARGPPNPGSILHGPRPKELAVRPPAGLRGCIVYLHLFPGKAYYT